MGAPDLSKLKAVAEASARALARAEADAAAIAQAKATPRTPDVVMLDFMKLVAMRLGNRQDLQLLIAEFDAAAQITPAESAAPAAAKKS